MRRNSREKSAQRVATHSDNSSVSNCIGLDLNEQPTYILESFALNSIQKDIIPMELIPPQYKLTNNENPRKTSTQLTCSARLHDFSQNSTLHGVRYICMEGAFILRR